MRRRATFPRAVRTVSHVWIPLEDGCRLAARLWLPEGAEEEPVPAILEYIPYRKNDATAARDARIHAYFAGHGYVSVRVDMRGSGDSDGLLLGEYLPREQEDALSVLRWLAAQPWCNGRIGMMGKSWGGFNSLQVAARRPPELGAIVTVCSTDDRYADDVHYMGGCLLASDMLPWASTMLAYNARPPDPAVVGERWREMWLERLEHTPPFVEDWLAHQRRDAFWEQGSVCEDFAAIECPVYAVGGWADAYRTALLRLLGGLSCPRKCLIGPWSHNYPHEGVPGPAIGFLQECLRWWDHWLRGIDTGIMEEPMLRAFMQEREQPRTAYRERRGRWVGEASWPSQNVRRQALPLPALRDPAQIAGAQAAGAAAGSWCGWGLGADLPPDQRGEDGLALSLTSEPLGERLEILGAPEVVLVLSADRPRALVAVRLCDVAPDGSSALVSRGLLNLAHRESHADPTALEPGRTYEVPVALGATGHAFPRGHRVRVAVSPTYWPFAWPSPEPVTLTLSSVALTLPVRAPQAADAALAPLGEPEAASDPVLETFAPGVAPGRRRRRDAATGAVELEVVPEYFPSCRLEGGLEYREQARDRFRIVEGDPLSASVRCDWTIAIRRGEWDTRVATRSTLSADAALFRLTNVVDAYEGESRIFSKAWTASIPRDLI